MRRVAAAQVPIEAGVVPRFDRIVVGVDSPAGSATARRLAQVVASAPGAIRLVHVMPESSQDFYAQDARLSSLVRLARERERGIGKALRATAKKMGPQVDAIVVAGSVARSLMEEGHTFGAGLIVVGSHRPDPGRANIGSTAKAVLRSSDLPVLVARRRAAEDPSQPLATLAVATDFSPCDEEAGRWSSYFARQTGARLRMVHVVDPLLWWDEGPKLSTARSRMAGKTWGAIQEAHQRRLAEFERHCPSEFCETRQLTGRPVDELLRFVEDENVDLLVLGTRSMDRYPWLPLGSVAGELAERAPCSVLVWRTPGPGERPLDQSPASAALRRATGDPR